jgi:hypothetical protein
MADAHIAKQTAHMAGSEYIANQTIIFTQKQPPVVTSNHTGGVLSAMLQNSQSVE